MIEIKTKEDNLHDPEIEGIEDVGVMRVSINGIWDDESFVSGERPYSISLVNDDIIDILLKHSFQEVGDKIAEFSYSKNYEWWKEGNLLFSIICNDYANEQHPQIQIELNIENWENWAKPFSMSQLAKIFDEQIRKIDGDRFKYWQRDDVSMLGGFGLEYYPDSLDQIIETEIIFSLSKLQNLIEATHNNLLLFVDHNVLLTYFKFPEEVKTACQQYLVYFSQFIADLGISVTTELREELNLTLFKVTPKEERESLGRIRQALDIYLNSPDKKDFETQLDGYVDVSVMQWQANVMHLKSQLLLAKSIIQSKDATIESLQLSNYQYRQLLHSHQGKEVDEEPIVSDLVSVKPLEVKGLKINLPEIFRRLKRRLNSKDK